MRAKKCILIEKMLKISFFGKPEIKHSEAGVVDFDPTEIQLLAYLWVNRSSSLPRSTIYNELWPEKEEGKRSGSLRTSLSKLKKINSLDEHEYILISKAHLQFNPEAPVDVDVASFESQIEALDESASDYIEVLEALRETYTGDFLAGIKLSWELEKIQSELLDQLDSKILEPLAFQYRQDQRYEQAVEISQQRLLRRYYSEDVYQDLIYFYYLLGDRDHAIHYYKRCEEKLAELETRPSADTEKLYQLVLERASAQEINELAEKLKVYASYPELSEQFIGRETECTKILSHWENVSRGKGRTLFVAGVSGVGKTALIRNFTDYFKNQDAIVLSADCRNSSPTDPYRPWIELLQDSDEHITSSLVNRLGAPRLAEVGELFPALYERFPELERPPELAEYSQNVTRRSEAVAQYLLTLSDERPLVVMLDNLQWIEDAAFRVLAHLKQRIGSAPIFLLGAYREENVLENHLLYEPMREWGESQDFECVGLKPFSREEISEYIVKALDLDEAPESLINWLLGGSQGKAVRPLYLSGILTWLMRNGAIEQDDHGSWHIDEEKLSLIDPPSQIKGLVLGNLEQLDRRTQELARLASTRASYFDSAFLEEALDTTIDNIEPNLDALRRCHFILGSRHGYEFDHDMTREIIYEGLSDRQRKRYHLQTAQALESLHEQSVSSYGNEVLGEIADHFTQGGDQRNALHHSLSAGEYIWTHSYAKEEALRYFNSGLELSLNISDADAEHQAYFWIGKIQCSTDAHEAGIENCQKALNYSEDVSERVEIYTMMINACRALHKYDEALEYADQGLEELDESENPVEVAKLLDRSGFIHLDKRDAKFAIPKLEKSVNLLNRTNERLLLSTALVNLSLALTQAKQVDQALEQCKEALIIAEELQSVSAQANVYYAFGHAYCESTEPQRAIDWWERAARVYLQIGDLMNAGWTYGRLAQSCIQNDRLKEALDFGFSRLKIWEKLNNQIEKALSLGKIGAIHLAMGNLGQSKVHLDQALAEKVDLSLIYYSFVLNFCELNDQENATKWLDHGRSIISEELMKMIDTDPRFSILHQ